MTDKPKPIDFAEHARSLGGLAIAIVPMGGDWMIWGKSNPGVIHKASFGGISPDDEGFADKVADISKDVIRGIVQYNAMTRDQLVDVWGEGGVKAMEGNQ